MGCLRQNYQAGEGRNERVKTYHTNTFFKAFLQVVKTLEEQLGAVHRQASGL